MTTSLSNRHQLSKRAGLRRVPVFSVLAGTFMALAMAVPTTAAGFDTQTLVSSQQHQYAVAAIAADGSNVAVAWEVDAYGQPAQTQLRVSTDSGAHFNPAINIGNATNVALSICGGFVVAERVGPDSVALDLVPLDGSPVASRFVVTGRPISYGAGIACVGGRQLGVSWLQRVGGAWHLKLAVVPVTEALPTYQFDAGRARFERQWGIASSSNSIWLGWGAGHSVYARRYDVAADAGGTVMATPRVIVAQPGDTSVSVAQSDGRLYVAYQRPYRALMRISRDGGQSFGVVKVIYNATSIGQPAWPISLVAHDNYVLAEIALGVWGSIPDNYGLYSTDWGRHWLKTPMTTGGYMIGALGGSGPDLQVVEAWDNRTSHAYLHEAGAITFRVGLPS